MHRSRLAALLLFVVLTVPLWAATDRADDNLENNARLLQKWKADPEHYARLQRDWHALATLSAERQAKLRQFDRELHDCNSETQKRLWETLERYAIWLDQLPEAERQRLLAIPDKHERIQAIKEKRQQQWLERLPEKDRDYFAQHPEEIARRYKEDLERRIKWQAALRRPRKPAQMEDFPNEVQEFINTLLMPMLHVDEKERVKNTAGWPALAQTILELSDKHPVLPPTNNTPIVRVQQVDRRDQPLLGKGMKGPLGKGEGPLAKHEGRWPDFALAATDFSTRFQHILARPLGASKPAEFPQEIQEFLKDQLLPAITPVEAERLRLTEGHWPAYPKLLHEFAKKYHLVIPGMSLPGPRELWESARTAALPEVPDHVLREFVGELSSEDVRKLNLSPMDPSSRDRMRQEFFRHHPHELNRMRELDERKMEPRKK